MYVAVCIFGERGCHTCGFAHCEAHGHHTHRALNALIARNGTPGDDHVFHALRQQSAVGNAVRFARAVAGITLFTVNLADGCKLRFLERIVHVEIIAVAADLVRKIGFHNVILHGQLVIADDASAFAHAHTS